jgi:tetratricopeptide (TPR) repeat protein
MGPHSIRVLEKLGQERQSPALLVEAADAALAAQLPVDAERLLRRAIDIDPQSPVAYTKLGLLLEAAGRFTEAETALQASLAIIESQPVLTILGSIQRRLGKDKAATIALRKSVALSPSDADAHHALALVLRDTAPAEAIDHFRIALSVEPSHPYSYREMRRALWKANRVEEAINACLEAIRQDPSDGWAHNYLGNLYFVSQRLEDAHAEFHTAAQLEPENAFFWAILGRISFAMARTADADAYFKRAASLALDDPYVFREYGLFLMTTGRLTRAKKYLSRALRLDPDDRRALEALEEIGARRGGSVS